MRQDEVTKTEVAERLRLFELATQRQKERERLRPLPRAEGPRDWTREDLYVSLTPLSSSTRR